MDMLVPDAQSVERLDTIHAALNAVGVLTYLHAAAQQLWVANRDRYEPEELFDDGVTLGLTSARNLSNRVRHDIPRDAALTNAGVHVTLDHNAVVIRTGIADLRLVKAPLKSRRRPDFGSDFRWTATEGRLGAARRNSDAYTPANDAGTLFELPTTQDASVAVGGCRDVFVVWAGELDSGLTAGWLGLPAAGHQPFLAVVPAWWDEAPRTTVAEPTPTNPTGDITFGDRPAPTPRVTLKPRKEEQTP